MTGHQIQLIFTLLFPALLWVCHKNNLANIRGPTWLSMGLLQRIFIGTQQQFTRYFVGRSKGDLFKTQQIKSAVLFRVGGLWSMDFHWLAARKFRLKHSQTIGRLFRSVNYLDWAFHNIAQNTGGCMSFYCPHKGTGWRLPLFCAKLRFR